MLTQCSSCTTAFFCGVSNTKTPCWCTAKAPVLIDATKNGCFCEPCLDKHIVKCGEFSSFRFQLSYQGTDFAGFQFQPNLRTVEGEFKKALESIVQQDISIEAAGRTDSGVHAHGQVISVQFFTRMTLRQLTLALATKLPPDMAVWRIDKMPGPFSARRQSIGKHYIYRIQQGLVVDPFVRAQVWHVRNSLNVESMNRAAKHLIGEHDFSSFRGALCGAAHAIRYIWHVGIERKENIIEIDVRGNAFCLNMVRIIVGTLVDVGRGKIKEDAVKDILLAKNRKKAGMTAPPQGLTLNKVYFPDDVHDALIPNDARFPRYPVSEESWPLLNADICYGP